MKGISTIDESQVSSGRRVGNTTRAVDKAIQILFKGETAIVKDPWENGERRDCNEYLLRRIIDRLWIEHHIDKNGFQLGYFRNDFGKVEWRTIRLIQDKTNKTEYEVTD